MSDDNIRRVLSEVRILASLQSKYIPEYIESFIDDKDKALWIITEYLNGGDL